MKKTLLLILALFAAWPGLAAAAPLVDCWIDAPVYVGRPAVGAFYEAVEVSCRNKGTNDAVGVTPTLTLPAGVTMTLGTNQALLGTLPVGNSPKTAVFNVTISPLVVVGTKLKWLLVVPYTDGATAQTPETGTAISKVVKPKPVVEIGIHNGNADFSPDGNYVVYRDDATDDLKLYSVRNAVSSFLTVDLNISVDREPVFSPNGRRIAWQKEFNGNDCIYVMDANGTNQVKILDSSSIGEDWRGVEWLPDGRLVARYSLDNGLYVFNGDGTGLLLITPPGFDFRSSFDVRAGMVLVAGDPAWSDLDLLVYNINNGETVASIFAYGEAYPGKFRPGFNQVLFRDTVNGFDNLFTQNFDGSGLRALTGVMVNKEYQLSNNSTSITLDHRNIIAIKGVWRADAPTGKNYWNAAGVAPVWGYTVTIPLPVSATPTDRIPVLVSYTYLPEYDSSSASYSKSGGTIVYISEMDGERNVWAMTASGKRKTRFTFGPDVGGGGRRLPMISPNGSGILFTNSSTGNDVLTLIKL